ncbi:MAG: cation:proton antiporter [Candidatus Obscuribacterales bacterium]|nr:cation:proton antiporter [Candidatus Obscuribacterales bacterium]
MSEFALINDLTVIWVSALVAGYLCVRLKQPIIAGYILSGIVIGPFGLKLIVESEQIHVLAEFGVALLLFALGVEVSLKQILGSNKKIVLAGITQIILTIAVSFGLAFATGLTTSLAEAFVFGSICALSSSVIVTKILMERSELDSLHGQLLIPILIIQDISLVPLISLLPVLKDPGAGIWSILSIALFKALVLVFIVFWGATRLVPYLLSKVVHSNYRELFLLLIISICLAIALASNYLGLSLALGAFLAGIMISESTFGHQALAEMLPLRDLFSIIFFVSVGMLLNPVFIAGHLTEVLIFVGLLIIGKALVGALAARIATKSLRAATLCGVGLAQIGEFSFVVAMLGSQHGIIGTELYNLFFAGAVVSLIASPLIMSAAPSIIHKMSRSSGKKPDRRLKERDDEPANALSGHVVLLGYGRTGHNLGQVLQDFKIPFVVVEMNASVLEELSNNNIPHIYGDAASRVCLLRTNLRTASCLVITTHDPIATMTIIDIARHNNPDLKIIARAHRSEDIAVFRAAGANAVVQPEFEAGIEITRLALLSLNQSDPQIKIALNNIRTKRYSLFKPDLAESDFRQLIGFAHEDHMRAWFIVQSPDIAGKSLSQLNIRGKTGATVIAIKRAAGLIPHPHPSQALELNDELFIIGDANQLSDCESELVLQRFSPLTELTSDEISLQSNT